MKRIVSLALRCAVIALVLTVFAGIPLYQKWLGENLLRFVLSHYDHVLNIAGEFLISFLLWFVLSGMGGLSCAVLFGIFTLFEIVPVLLLQAPAGPFEFACLCLMPACWTVFTWISGFRFKRGGFLVKGCMAAIVTGGIVQYIMYMVYVMRYGRRLGSTTMMTMLGTNLMETRAYLAEQFGLWQTLASFALLFALMALFVMLVRHCKKLRYPSCGVVVFLVLLSVLCWCCSYAEGYRNLFLDFHKGYEQYRTALDSLEEARSDPSRRTEDLHITKEHRGEVCVVVIGESASRLHMPHWGYNRPTTPWFDSRDFSLILLDKAYSCMVHTEPAVTMALSLFSNYDSRLLLTGEEDMNQFVFGEIMRSFSLIEILKGAGVKTYWLSNQDKIGVYNNLISAMAQGTDEQIFLQDMPVPPDRKWGHQDSELLPVLQRILVTADPAKDHVIFIHLRGNHWSYRYDAPEGWPWLPESPEVNARPKEIANRINAYDRSLTYTDSVLIRMRESLREAPFQVSSLLYFSDHGEDVDGRGHNFDEFCPEMAKIPVAMWFSLAYQARYPETVSVLKDNAGAVFTNDLVAPLVLGLNHISYDGENPQLQLTSPSYAVNPVNARFWQGRLLRSMIPDLEQQP